MSEAAHSRLSASAASRWMQCPGSIRLSAKAPKQKQKEHTAEGTAAHMLAETCLRMEVQPETMKGQELKTGGFSFEVTSDMIDAVQIYVDTINEILMGGKNRKLMIETKFALDWVHKDIGGTADAVIWDKDKSTMWVIDYKHGVGTEVHPERNPQCMIYALGALQSIYLSLPTAEKKNTTPMQIAKTINLVIVQPRLRGSEEFVKSWETTSDYLHFWAHMMLAPSAKECDDDEAFLKVGDGCKWCPALATCPAQMKRAQEVAKTDFQDPVFQDEGSLTDDELSKVMLFQEGMSAWVDAVSAYAVNKMKEGRSIPGYKLVRSKTNRKWANEDLAETSLRVHLGDAAFKTKLITVKQAEDIMKKKGISIFKFEDFWTKPEGDLIVVPESDKRQAEATGAIPDFMENIDILN